MSLRNDAARLGSNLDVTAELDNPVWRDPEKLGRVERIVRHQNEEPVAPTAEGGATRPRPQPQLFATDDEGGLHQIEAQAANPALREGAQDVRLFGEAVADVDRVEALAELGDVKPLLVRHVRYILGL